MRGSAMSEVDRELCRRSAAECVELARITTDAKTKEILLRHAQEWIKLAYSGSDAQLQQLLAEFNSQQLGATLRPQASMQQQQQPQPDGKPDDEPGQT